MRGCFHCNRNRGVEAVKRMRRVNIETKQMEMTFMNTVLRIIGVASLAVFLNGCDSPQEDARENALENKADTLEERADMTRDAGEQQADRIEAQDPGLDAAPTDSAAEATRDSTETQADTLEEQADQVRDQQ